MWYENEEKYKKYMKKMFKGDLEIYRKKIEESIEDHYEVPHFDVIGNLKLMYTGLDGISKLKKVINLINNELGVDECYVEVPPLYKLVWKSQVDREIFKEFTKEKIIEKVNISI